MQKNAVLYFLIAIVILVVIFACVPNKTNADYLRIHVRANSNDAVDQEVKYKVKAVVVDYLTPLLAGVRSKEEAQRIIQRHHADICRVADAVLADNGFDYRCEVKLTTESFPTRSYGNFSLPSGVYDALILNLGSGKGDNWWCVVYPPLCFGEGYLSEQITFRSWLKDNLFGSGK